MFGPRAGRRLGSVTKAISSLRFAPLQQTKVPRLARIQDRTNAQSRTIGALTPAFIPSSKPGLLRRIRHYGQRRQNSSSSSFSSGSSTPIIVYATIGICCGVFLFRGHALAERRERQNPTLDIFLKENMVNSLENWRAGRWWTLITCSFSHANLLHLGANMLPVYSLGSLIVQSTGVRGYILTWIGSSIACSGSSLCWDSYRETRDRQERDQIGIDKASSRQGGIHRYGGNVGASGALFGFSTAATLFYPKMSVMVFPLPIPMYLWVFNAVIAAGSVLCMWTDSIPILGHAGHLGGMAGGIACGQFLLRRG